MALWAPSSSPMMRTLFAPWGGWGVLPPQVQGGGCGTQTQECDTYAEQPRVRSLLRAEQWGASHTVKLD